MHLQIFCQCVHVHISHSGFSLLQDVLASGFSPFSVPDTVSSSAPNKDLQI